MAPEKRTLKHIYHELVGHPFFPLMFIGEAIKAAVGSGPVFEYTVLAFGAVVLWVLSDAIDVSVDSDRIIG